MVVFGYLVVHVMVVCKTAEMANIQLLDRIGHFTDKLKTQVGGGACKSGCSGVVLLLLGSRDTILLHSTECVVEH